MDRLLRNSLWLAAATAALIILLFLFVDRSAAWGAYALKNTFWHSLAKALSQIAGHNYVNAVLCLGLLAGAWGSLSSPDNSWGRGMLCFCVSMLVAMIFGDCLKYLFGRCRPPLLFSENLYGFTWLSGKYLQNSFPSGHTLRIFSAMTALALLLPRARVLFFSLAVLVGASRVLALKHYPSDVVFGAFIGILAALWVGRFFSLPKKQTPAQSGQSG